MAPTPALAAGELFCVGDPDCVARGGTPVYVDDTHNSIQHAVDRAAVNATSERDRIEVGPGRWGFMRVIVGPGNEVDIVGDGIGRTVFVRDDAQIPPAAFRFDEGDASLSDASVELGTSHVRGVTLNNGADISRVRIYTTDAHNSTEGLAAFGSNTNKSVVDDVTVGSASSRFASPVQPLLFGEADVTDSSFAGVRGGASGFGVSTLSRVSFAAHSTLALDIDNGANVTLEQSVLRLLGSPSAVSIVAAVTNADEPQPTILRARHVTAIGTGGGDVQGFFVWGGNSLTTARAHLELLDSVIRSTSTPIHASDGSGTAQVATYNSSYKQGSVFDDTPNGAFDQTAVTAENADPRFVAAGAGDFRLRHDSPLVDQGNTEALQPGESATDLSGRTRIRDGDGNGSARRDIGAFEYQRLAPVAVASVAPPSADVGLPVTFDATGSSDPDGEPLTYGWALTDGFTSSAGSFSHAFAAPGPHGGTVTVTDPAGLTANATAGVQVSGPTGGGSATASADEARVGEARAAAATRRSGRSGSRASRRPARASASAARRPRRARAAVAAHPSAPRSATR